MVALLLAAGASGFGTEWKNGDRPIRGLARLFWSGLRSDKQEVLEALEAMGENKELGLATLRAGGLGRIQYPGADPGIAMRTLFTLDDEPFIHEIGAMIQRRDKLPWGRYYHSMQGNPRLLKYYDEFILNDIPEIAPQTGVRPSTYSQRARDVVQNILRFGKRLPPEMHDWIKSISQRVMANGLTIQEETEEMRAWWLENRDAIMNDRFSEFKSPTVILGNASTPPAAPAPPSDTATAAPPAPVAPAAESSPSSNGLLWTAAAAIIALLAGLLFFWKPRV